MSVKSNLRSCFSERDAMPMRRTLEEGWDSDRHSRSSGCSLTGHRSMSRDYSHAQEDWNFQS